MKYKIAEFITEFEPRFDNLKNLAKPFEYYGSETTDLKLTISDEYLDRLLKKMKPGTTKGETENFAFASQFNRAITNKNAMLLHSSAIKYKGKAYLFSAHSGVGKSTHAKLWVDAFGSADVKYINDDKPVIRLYDNECIVYGTPFDGASGIANNDSAILGAIVFIERGKSNLIRKPTSDEIIKRMYFETSRFLNRDFAVCMLNNFERLISMTDFYILTCNMDKSAAILARDTIVK